MAIPKKMQATYDEIWSLIEPFCDECLDDDYRELLVHALEKLCRKRPSPLLSGRPKTWAAGIVYAIGQNNWIFDTHQPIHMTADDIASAFGVAKSTASAKAADIRKMLGIDHFKAEWILSSKVEKDPMLWMVSFNGLIVDARDLPLEVQMEAARRGIIPYVPALRQ